MIASDLQQTPLWIVKERDREAEVLLQKELKLTSLVAAVLAQRGYTDPDAAYKFLHPSLGDLYDPALLPDYAPAVKAILGAKERGELIFVHGDYDVDGVTSAAIFSRFLRKIGCDVVTHVPHRMKEGYGIHANAVEAACAAGAKLFLTCDCGISAHEQVDQAKEAGMTVVVTDHHTIGEDLPRAEAVVNAHRADSKYPYPELSGAGVVFKLCEGITKELGHPVEGYYRAFLDLAALGTIADVMPLLDENRIITRYGLEKLRETKKVGLQALMREAKIDLRQPLRNYHVGFVIGPRLNAAGRIDDAALALDLLLSNNPEEAQTLAKQIDEINEARKAEQQRIIDEAVQMVIEQGLHQKNVIMVGHESWHSGIVGIVAGRLVEQFYRPTFVLSHDKEKGIYKGSARTIPKFHLADAIRAQGDLFLSGGGHAMAAGCSFDESNLQQIADALHEHAGTCLAPEDFLPIVQADMEVASEEVTLNSVEALNMMEPFGCANPEPRFVARGVTINQIKPTKNPCHVQLVLRQGQAAAVKGIAFGIGERVTQTGAGAVVDLLFQPEVSEYRGYTELKWQVRDYCEAETTALL